MLRLSQIVRGLTKLLVKELIGDVDLLLSRGRVRLHHTLGKPSGYGLSSAGIRRVECQLKAVWRHHSDLGAIGNEGHYLVHACIAAYLELLRNSLKEGSAVKLLPCELDVVGHTLANQ